MSMRTFASTLRCPFTRNPPWKHSWSSIAPTSDRVAIHALNNTTFPYVWLRDSCQSCSECIHPSTKQKLHWTSDIPLDVKPRSLDSDGIKVTKDGLEIVWTDGHKSVFSREFLGRHVDTQKLHEFHKDIQTVAWNSSSIQKPGLFINYKEIQTPKVLGRAITQLARYGLLFVTGVPNGETSNETCELRKLGEIFGALRPTFYGLLWDVVNVKDSKNIAYTNLNLGLHTDLMYFQHPPRYQILHCLRNRVQGGASTFVDGLTVARALRETHPEYFETLTRCPVPFQYINDGHHLHCEHPTIELAQPSPDMPLLPVKDRKIKNINYSPPFQAPLLPNTPLEFYPAFKVFSELLKHRSFTYEYTLKEGDAVCFDNRRVLHARTAFYDREDTQDKKGEINRWLKGCYLEENSVMDRARVLKTKLEQGLD